MSPYPEPDTQVLVYRRSIPNSMLDQHRSDVPPSLEAAHQAQINDLVQRNRTLEYTNKKLSEKMTVEESRSKEAIQGIQKSWHEQEKLIREECEDLYAYYHFVQLSTVSELEVERLNVLKEQKALRQEKLLRLQRDFRLTMFHARERELEEKVAELEHENERMVVERTVLTQALKKKLSQLIAQLRVKDKSMADLYIEREVIEKDVSNLREENAHLQTSLNSTTSKLERVTLQLEGVQSSRSELEKLNEDLKRRNYDLQRQIDKWQRLENKGDEELSSLQKRKNELELEVKELHDRLGRVMEDNTKALDKEKKRVERLKETVQQWRETAEINEKRLKETKKEFLLLEKQVKTRMSPEPAPNKTTRATNRERQSSVTNSEAERPTKRKKHPSRLKKGTTSDSESDEVQKMPAPVKTSGKQKKMSPVIEEEEVVSEVEVVRSPPINAEKEAGVAGSKPRPRPITKPTGPLYSKEPTPIPALTDKTGRKRKASTNDSESESDKLVKKVAKKPRRTDSTMKSSSKRGASEGPATPTVDILQKQKKRKITVFAGAAGQSNELGFDFDLGTNGLNIPTSLTPLQEVEGPVPNRTVSSTMSGIGGLIRGRMGGAW